MVKQEQAPTYETIREELLEELGKLHGVSIYISRNMVSNDEVYGVQRDIRTPLDSFLDKLIDVAAKKFDALIVDKKRQLELGELADKFFQKVKLND